MTTKLAPCPFCGGPAEFYSRDDDSFIKTVVVRCRECSAELESSVDWWPFSQAQDLAGFNEAVAKAAAEVWNRRFTEAL